MKRRDFLASVAASGALSVLDPAYLAAKEKLARPPEQAVPRRQYGRHQDELSIIGFGGITVSAVTPEEAASFVAEAVDRGINYFDVAPTYGNAQERLGPALKPYRPKCFLACKTTQREAAGSAKELEESLRLLQTDHVDLYQLHGLTTVAEVEKVFGVGGAMETYEKARKEGKVRYIGFSAHSEEAAHAALDRFDFDSILFPLGFPTWIQAKFGPSVHQRAKEAGKGVLALKAMAHQTWPKDTKKTGRRWKKAWYQPFDDIDKVALALRFTLHLPVTAMIPPGHWELVKMALGLAQSGALLPLNGDERKVIEEIAAKSDPIFPKHA
jgi:predicted aldo/keto reductase-like oxidoreductase